MVFIHYNTSLPNYSVRCNNTTYILLCNIYTNTVCCIKKNVEYKKIMMTLIIVKKKKETDTANNMRIIIYLLCDELIRKLLLQTQLKTW